MSTAMDEGRGVGLICDECGKKLEPLKRAHDCDGGEALRKAAHELFAPTVDLIERTIAKAGTGVLRGVFEVAAERDRLRACNDALVAALREARPVIAGLSRGEQFTARDAKASLAVIDAALSAAGGGGR